MFKYSAEILEEVCLGFWFALVKYLFLLLVVVFFGLFYCSQAGFYYLEFIDSFNTKISFMAFIFIELYFFVGNLCYFINSS